MLVLPELVLEEFELEDEDESGFELDAELDESPLPFELELLESDLPDSPPPEFSFFAASPEPLPEELLESERESLR